MDIIDQVKERLSIFKNLYDAIRIIDPIKKEIINFEEKKVEELNETCYELWKRHKFCENCISMRAYINHDTFVKIEYDRDRVILITSTPIEINGKVFIAEILKDITQNGSALHKLTDNSNFVEELISSMNEKAITDELTGLYNRKYINERLPVDINYNKINELPLSIIMTDIDFFKEVNDKYGHVIGDKVLIEFSDLIMRSVRKGSDWVGRFGGEEFIIVLNNTELKDAYTVAENIRKHLENKIFNYDDININITASFGAYSVADYDMNITDLLSKVDKNLYKAKAIGRNITIINQDDVKELESTNIQQKNIKISELNKQINEMREILNEVCCTVDEGESIYDRLTISQSLDELIVKYMKEVNTLK